MYARTITFDAEASSINKGIAYIRDDVMPMAMALEGWVGLSMICDRDSGRCIVTGAWATQEALNGSEQTMMSQRERSAEIFGGKPTVERWEFAVLHRHEPSREGARVRCTWLSLDPAELTHAIETYRMTTLPALEEMDGFCSASLLVDREAGRLVDSATFAGRLTIESSRPVATSLRARIAQDIGATVKDVRECELAIAHLHVPEMVSMGH